jgi:hypothetical protein
MSLSEDLKIAEYEAVREELRLHQNAENQWILGSVTVCGALVAYALAKSSLLPLFAVPLSVYATQKRLESTRYYIFRIVGWVVVFIEQASSGGALRYESDLMTFRSRSDRPHSPAGSSAAMILASMLWSAVAAALFLLSQPFTQDTVRPSFSEYVATALLVIAAIVLSVQLNKFGSQSRTLALNKAFVEHWQRLRDERGR